MPFTYQHNNFPFLHLQLAHSHQELQYKATITITMFDPELGQFIQPFQVETAKKEIKKSIEILSQVSPSNEQVRKYNAIILNYLAQPRILQLLLHLLIEVQDNNAQAKILITFISAYLKKQNEHGVNIVRHNKKAIYQRMRQIFFCQTVSHSNKHLLQNCFTRFISNSSPDFISIRDDLSKSIVSYFNQQVSPSNLKNCFYLIRAILNSSLETPALRFMQQSLLMNFVTLSNQLVKGVKDLLQTQRNNPNIPSMIEWAYNVQLITQLLYLKAPMDKLAVLKEEVYTSTNFANLCHITLSLTIDSTSSYIIPTFACEQNSQAQYGLLNELKVSVLKMIENTFQILLKNRKHLIGPKYISVMTIADLFLDHIMPKMSEQITKYPYHPIANEQILIKSMIVLGKIIRVPHLQSKVMAFKDKIFFAIVFPCLLTSPKDLELNSQDFCRMKNKITNQDDDKDVSTVHQAAGKLLEALADEIDGMVTYAFRTILNLIDFQLTADPKYFHHLPQALVQSYYYQNCNYFQQIQAGLTILSIISYYGDNRMDLCEEFQNMIVRRQQFFSRIDVQYGMLVCFIQSCTFYLSNFCELIISGKVNPLFHQSLITHILELMSASYNVERKNFFDDDRGKIGYQALDYIENLVSQKLFFGALFPDHEPSSLPKLKNIFANICQYLKSQFAPQILQDVLIELLKRQINQTYQQKFSSMSTNLKGQLSIFLTQQLFQYYGEKLPNDTICKVKIFQCLKMLMCFSDEPVKLIQIGLSHLEYMLEKQFVYLGDLIEVLQVFMKRVHKESLKIPATINGMIQKCLNQGIRVSDNQVFQNVLFDLIIHCNLLGIYSNTIVEALLTLFQDNKVERQVDQSAQVIMEKSLYLILQICFSHFNKVNGGVWLMVIDEMITYLKDNYVRQDTLTVGKSVAICLCCYAEDPQGFQQYLSNRMEGLWDCIIQDQLKYATKTQKKIVAFKILQLLSKPSVRPSVSEKTMAILKCALILIYYNYEKQQISWHHDDDDMDSMKDSSEDNDEKYQPWIDPFATIRNNPFLQLLPDQILVMRDICHQINQKDSKGFEKFIQAQPIGLQNLIRNKVYNYKPGQKSQLNKKLRTIVKVKRPENFS